MHFGLMSVFLDVCHVVVQEVVVSVLIVPLVTQPVNHVVVVLYDVVALVYFDVCHVVLVDTEVNSIVLKVVVVE